MSQERHYNVLRAPHVTDKAYRVGDQSNQVTFKVATWATKHDIKQAVEKLFEVEVADVTTVNVNGKARRSAKGVQGRTQDWKKAYVRLKPGHDINFVDAE
jgi:large subunit ribosomal protein L23